MLISFLVMSVMSFPRIGLWNQSVEKAVNFYQKVDDKQKKGFLRCLTHSSPSRYVQCTVGLKFNCIVSFICSQIVWYYTYLQLGMPIDHFCKIFCVEYHQHALSCFRISLKIIVRANSLISSHIPKYSPWDDSNHSSH